MNETIDRRIRGGIVGIVVAAAVVVATLNYDKLQFLRDGIEYSANFTDAGGLVPGDRVQVAGIEVGNVEHVELDGKQVLVTFTVKEGIQLGEETSAAIKTNTVLGRRSLALTPSGTGKLTKDEPIPVDRTTAPYSLNDALGDLSAEVHDLDTKQVNEALDVLSTALKDTPAPLRETLDGVTRLSKALNDRDQSLRDLLTKAQGVTKILADRGDQINALLLDGNDLLGALELRRSAISELITNISGVSQQLSGLVHDNEEQIGPTLEKLNSVTALLIRNKDNLSRALDGLGPYATALGEAVASGPYFQAFVQNYGSGKMLQGLVDAFVDPQHLPADLYNYLLDPPPSIQLREPR